MVPTTRPTSRPRRLAALPIGVDPAPPEPPASPDRSGEPAERRRRTHSPSRRRRLGRTVKLAVVVQRYGADISGGAELHARYVAEMLARRHRVEVLTTCAHDYVTWKAHYAEGTETVNGVPVRRFPVARERDPQDFGQRSTQVFERRHSVADEIAWLDSEGPTSPALIDYIGQQADAFDFFLFFSYRYYHAWHGVRRVPHKAILVPTAERDAALGLSIFAPVFRAARGADVQLAGRARHHPGRLRQHVGAGRRRRHRLRPAARDRARSLPPQVRRRRARSSIYVGRIDANKGCAELFDYFGNYRPRLGQQLSLILAGTSILPIPTHPRIRHLGFISDRDKFDAIAASEALIMPSRFESLSMVALEAWGLGRPVLANGRCDVLRGQTIRSRAGLYYDDFPEFAEALFTLTSNRPLHQAFGENGRRFYERHYAWPVIQRKYQDMLGQLSRASAAPAAVEALPGWLARRRRTLAPAQEVVDGIAKGPVAYDEPAAPRGRAVARPVRQPAGPAPRPSPVAGRQAVRSGPHGRGRRPQGNVRIAGSPAGRPPRPAGRAGWRQRQGRRRRRRERRPRTGAGRRARGIARTAAGGRTGRAANGGRRGGTDDRPGARRLDGCRRARRGRASRPSGAGDARLRRRHRPRGARHPEGAARRRLPLGHLRRDRRLAARGSDPRLSRPDRRGDARDRPHPPLLDRIARLARRLRAAGADDPRLPQHHAAGVLRRRAPAAGGAVLPRSPRARRLRLALRAGARRLRVQPAGAGRARLPADRRPAGRPELRSPRRRARSHDGRRPSTTAGPTCCSSAGSSRTRRSRTSSGTSTPTRRGTTRGRGCCWSARRRASSATSRCCRS